MRESLVEILEERSELTTKGITFIESGEKDVFVSYQQLYCRSLHVLSVLQSQGLKSKDELVFQIGDNEVFVFVFWACILGGIIPVPLTIGRNEDHRQKLFNIWKVLNNPYIIISVEDLHKIKKHAEVNQLNRLFDSMYERRVDVENIQGAGGTGTVYRPEREEIAYIQFSSGSTGLPKGIVLTHKNLITNMEAIALASNYTQHDSMLSWMPVTHDMGLIGFHLCPLYSGMNHYLMPTNLFIRRPALWLDKASQYKTTVLCSPNFGCKYLLKQYRPGNDYSWDLSDVRIIYNGAEPIFPEICSEFSQTLESYGLMRTAVRPVYGLAEASVAVSFSESYTEVASLSIERKKLRIGEPVILRAQDENTVSFVNVGKTIPYCRLKITDNNNDICSEDVIGHVRIQGDNVTSGYYNNPEATKKVISGDGWLDTGDLGFIHDRCLYITGRSKDIFFVNGQNYYPHDIERSLEVIDDIELGKVVVAGCTTKNAEQILVFILHKGTTEKFIELHDKVKKHVNLIFGFEPDHIIPIREIPKTTSGKIQRFKLIEEYISGSFAATIRKIKELSALSSFDKRVEPVDEIEQRLYVIWSNILSHGNFGVTDKFFEIGGNSLKGAQVISYIHKEFGVELDHTLLYEKQTIREFAATIEDLEKTAFHSICETTQLDSYPLSSAQERLYYLWEVNKSSTAYNIPVAFMIRGELDTVRLEKSIRNLIERHEILRATFIFSNGELRQKFEEKSDFALTVTQIDPGNLGKELKRKVRPHDLNKGPLFRFELLCVSAGENVLFMDLHHIISDGISMSLLVDELFKNYHGEPLPEAEIRYRDYIQWEHKNAESEKIRMQSEFWLEQFNDYVPVLNLSTDYPRPSLMDHRGGKIEFRIDSLLTTKLKNLAKTEETSLFILLLSAYHIFLYKYTGQEDLVTGVPVAGRNHSQLRFLQEMFVNNLAIRSYVDANFSFSEFTAILHRTCVKALDNQDYPFGKLVERIGHKRDISRNSLIDTMFIFQNMEISSMKKAGLTFQPYFFDPGTSKYDLSLEVFVTEEEINLYFEYSMALFQRITILRMADYFENLLKNIVEIPHAKVVDLSILSGKDYNEIVVNYNKTELEYPGKQVIHELIEAQALKNPGEIAVVHGNQGNNGAMTYGELNERSGRLAGLLRKKGVAPDTLVAVTLDRKPELIVAILAILKASGAFLPIDKDLPKESICGILEDSKARWIITDSKNLHLWETDQIEIEWIDIADDSSLRYEPPKVVNINTPGNLAYVIYTSGTSGKPKGVMVEHRSLVNYASFANRTYIKDEKVYFPLYTSISFDLTITSIFAPLISGNTIITYPGMDRILSLEEVWADNRIHILKATPSHLRILKEYRNYGDPEKPCSIRRIIVGGEVFPTSLAEEINRLFGNEVEIYNEYGPTEATVGCMIYRYHPEKEKKQTVPIGIPIDNMKIYLLDQFLKPVPVGGIGEIYIGGDGLARGYIFNPELTEEKFIDNPFVPGRKMYKTGDMVKRLSYKNMEFIGRVDKQIKINGYRIETEGIEQQILTCDDVREVAVTLNDNGTLCAYVVTNKSVYPKESSDISRSESEKFSGNIKSRLQQNLPSYMVPQAIIFVDYIPLTRNGKIDYRLLPVPVLQKTEKKKAVNDLQKLMVTVWQNILKEEVGIEDNFFELGGDSIKAVQITSRLFEHNISVRVRDILTHQTIKQVSLFAQVDNTSVHYEQVRIEGSVLLSPIQKWVFDQNFENPDFYNQSVLLKFRKPVNYDILKKTFEMLMTWHDGLRMNYDPEQDVMFYNNSHEQDEFDIVEYWSEAKDTEDAPSDLKDICFRLRNSFDITKTKLLRAGLIHMESFDLLFITAHHLVIDGVSWRILLDDFFRIYTSLQNDAKIIFPGKTASMLDMKWTGFSIAGEFDRQQEYWEQETGSASYFSDTDSKRQLPLVKDIKKYTFLFNEDDTRFLLTDANKPYNTNIEVLLLAALLQTLNQISGRIEWNIEIESHGRHFEEIDVSRSVGWFTSIFPVKFNVNSPHTGELIKYIKEKIRKLTSHGAGYGYLKYIRKSISSSAFVPEVRFNYMGQFDRETNNELFSYQRIDTGPESSLENHITTKIDINAMIIGGQLGLEIGSVEKDGYLFSQYFQKNLEDMISYLKNEGQIYLTPSDFDAVDLTDDELESLIC